MFVEDKMKTVSSPRHEGNKGRHDELRQSSNAPKAQAAQGGSVCDMRRFSAIKQNKKSKDSLQIDAIAFFV